MKILLAYKAISRYDAIAADILREYAVLKEHGYDVCIFADYADKQYESFMIDENTFEGLIKDQHAAIILHHGGYWDRITSILHNIKARLLLKYHNVTPAEFFEPYSPEYCSYSHLGRKQTRDLAESGKVSFFVADSTFNTLELKHCGVPDGQIAVLPPFHRLHEYEAVSPDIGVLEGLLDGKTNVLFIGRVAPNKGHKHLIKTIRNYVRHFGREIRVNIVGGVDPMLTSYYNELVALIAVEGLSDIIHFRHHVALSELFSYYLGSHAFLLLSEHEGFCVPILEAQHHSVPIIALDRTAVRETLGEGQLIFRDVDYDVFAMAVHRVSETQDVRSYLVANGRENCRNYSTPNLDRKFVDLIHEKLG